MPEKPDGFTYRWFTIFPDSMRFFISAARHYQAQLDLELDRIKSDALFSSLFGDAEIQSLELAKEAKRFKGFADRLQEKVDASPDAWDYEINVIHRDVRILKALGNLYLGHLRGRRNELAASGQFSTLALQAIDARLARFSELLSSGAFSEATEWPLLVLPPSAPSAETAAPAIEHPASAPIPAPRVLSNIEIVDPQLRERCLDLLETFDAGAQPHRFDTVISEATRVLEDRIRRFSGADSSLDGVKLVAYAFGGERPRLVISNDASEQEPAHLMIRGVFGYVRNPFHHRLVEQVQIERVIQMLALIDFLLFIVQGSQRAEPQDA